MPCIYDDGGASQERQRNELDKVTRLLCEVCKTISSHDLEAMMSGELSEWWDAHQLADRRREERLRERKRLRRQHLSGELERIQNQLRNMDQEGDQ